MYGLRVNGLEAVDALVDDPPASWLSVAVNVDQAPPPAGPGPALNTERAALELPDGRLLKMDRVTRRATFHGPALEPDDLAHPYLGPVGSIFARWDGREAFHAGAVAIGGGAFGVVGGKEAGKSTLLAALAGGGADVVADDLVVTDGERVFAGPRCVDLRPPPLAVDGAILRPVRNGERLRVALGAVPPETPLRGWLFLEWDDAPARLAKLPASELVVRLIRWRAGPQLPSDAAMLLRLGALPAWRLRRPRDADAIGSTAALLLDRLG